MDKRNIKIFLILASIGIFIFACITSVISINFYNRRVQCLYNGAVYNNGEKFMSSDNCNMCACNNGSVSCTLKACLNNNSTNIKLPLKGLEIYCYTANNQQLYSILPGTNRLKTYEEVTGALNVLSSPVEDFINKSKEDASQILLKYYGYNEQSAEYALQNCTPAEDLK